MNPMPTPAELLEAPEFAILAVLRTTLDAAKATLTSVHPDLYAPEDHLPDQVFPGSSATVWTLLTLGQALKEQIDLYRRLADIAKRHPRNQPPTHF